MAFYLLTLTFFHDVNVGTKMFINSQLIRILFISHGKKNLDMDKTEKDRKNHGKRK